MGHFRKTREERAYFFDTVWLHLPNHHAIESYSGFNVPNHGTHSSDDTMLLHLCYAADHLVFGYVQVVGNSGIGLGGIAQVSLKSEKNAFVNCVECNLGHMSGFLLRIGILYTVMYVVNKQNSMPCIVFPLGVEAYQFLSRVEVTRRWKRGKATFRRVFFEGHVFSVVRCGMGPQRAAAAIQNLDDEPSAIICAGSAGGLLPDLKVGHFVVSSETVAGDHPQEIVTGHSRLVEQVTRACRNARGQYRIGRLVTVNSAVFRREERQALHLETGASAVDMESHAIGLEAMRRSVPFTALRVISDDLDSPSLPDSRDFRNMWRKPMQLHKKLPEFLRWRAFLRNFRHAVAQLNPVLVTVIREWNTFHPQA